MGRTATEGLKFTRGGEGGERDIGADDEELEESEELVDVVEELRAGGGEDEGAGGGGRGEESSSQPSNFKPSVHRRTLPRQEQ